MATAEEYAKMSDAEKKKEDWMNSKWRPMMGWSYMLTCICDFVAFPILWSIIQVIGGGEVKMQWNPITLQGAGLYHVAMGAVLGLAAWGRTQEKMAGANNGGLQPVSQSVTTTFGTAQSASSFGSPVNSFNTAPRQNTSFSSPASAIGGAAVGAAAGAGIVSAQGTAPMMAPPQPSRPPFEDNHPELD